LLFYFMGGVAACHYMLRNYELAVEKAHLAIQRYSQYPSAHRWLAVSLAQSGRTDEARQALAKFLEISPGSREAARRAYLFKQESDLAHYLEGLEKAGLPKQ
jgi:adenylate cyclase